jgi:hypothetical protein
MKKILIFLFCIALLTISCENSSPASEYGGGYIESDTIKKEVNTRQVNTTVQNSKATSIEYLTGPLTNDGNSYNGLYKITLEDGREILIYRGIESVSMIQLK